MRVFVTGATGMIGRALVPRLLARGDEVLAFVRDPERARGVLGPGVELLGTSADEPALSASLGRSTALVNLGGEPLAEGRWTEARKRALRESRVGLTRRLVSALEAVDERPRVLVSGSAVGYYGDRGDAPLTEDDAAGPDFAARLCVDWENAALAAERGGTRVVRVRTGVVLSGTGGALAKMLPAFRLGLGGPLGSGVQVVPWIHLNDEIAILLAALDDERLTGPVNATAPEPVTSREFAAALGRALGRPARVAVPGFALRLALGEVAGLLLGGQRALPRRLEAVGFRFCFPGLDAALADLLAAGPGGAPC